MAQGIGSIWENWVEFVTPDFRTVCFQPRVTFSGQNQQMRALKYSISQFVFPSLKSYHEVGANLIESYYNYKHKYTHTHIYNI